MRPLKPISPTSRAALGVAFLVAFIAAWSAVTYGGYVPPLFLASPGQTLRAGWALFTEFGFAGNIAITLFRVVGGFLIAAPIGLATGAFKPVEAFFEPFMSFARYLPASAFIPLLLLWAGVDEKQKLAVIVTGSVFQLIIMVSLVAGAARQDLVEAAYTLGSRPAGIVRGVIIPAAAPQVMETLRLLLGWAWTYVIVVELIGAQSGIGHMIMDSQRLLDTGQMIFGIAVIDVIGLAKDMLFKAMNRTLFPWAAL
ncbi:MAG: transporter permease [Rhodospirillales bacterium]|nr:transporter permease [Rhodospirillales bacterium]